MQLENFFEKFLDCCVIISFDKETAIKDILDCFDEKVNKKNKKHVDSHIVLGNIVVVSSRKIDPWR